jgi:hypothetical protein
MQNSIERRYLSAGAELGCVDKPPGTRKTATEAAGDAGVEEVDAEREPDAMACRTCSRSTRGLAAGTDIMSTTCTLGWPCSRGSSSFAHLHLLEVILLHVAIIQHI